MMDKFLDIGDKDGRQEAKDNSANKEIRMPRIKERATPGRTV